ncbi:hypothetical protein NUU61_006645, partial [Penicillium alfredii]
DMSASTRPSSYDAGPQLLKEVWALTAVAILITALRIPAKLRVGKLGWDDALMSFALVSNIHFSFCLAIIGSAMLTLAIKHGFGQHIGHISTTNIPKAIMYDYSAQAFGIAGGTVGRIAFIVFIVGLLGARRSHSIVLWTLVGLQPVANLMFIVIIFVQCPGHVSAIWAHTGKEKCWDLRVQAFYGYFQGSFNSATDLYLAIFPTYIFWSLNLKLRVKLGLAGLLGLGIFAMTASIIKTVQTQVLASADSDPTTATVNYDRWLYIETYLVIITASIPCLRSLVRSVRGRTSGTNRYTHALSSPYIQSPLSISRNKRQGSTIAGKGARYFSDGNASAADILQDSHDRSSYTQPSKGRRCTCV